MTIRVGINGFGRIGRNTLRALLKTGSRDIEVVHINDLTDTQTLAHLLRYDSVHGRVEGVSVDGQNMMVQGKPISVSAIPNPAEIPWGQKHVDIVFECTGIFRSKVKCEGHIKAGAKKVLISAPGENEDITIVYGVNSKDLKPHHTVVSNASCTTNCLAPLTSVVHQEVGIESGLMNTIHSYTNDQMILDLPHKDLRRSRAAAINMIPTSTGAAKAIGLVIPELAGKIDGLAVRVPTADVSIVDVTFQVKKATTAKAINEALTRAAAGSLKGILEVTNEPLVSSDFIGSSASSVVDLSLTKVINERLVKILAWYDNEIGFSHRMIDVARLMGNP